MSQDIADVEWNYGMLLCCGRSDVADEDFAQAQQTFFHFVDQETDKQWAVSVVQIWFISMLILMMDVWLIL